MMFKNEFSNVNTVIVHGGVFHLDDLAVCALARMANPDCEIRRENEPDLTQAGPNTGVMIADVGKVHDPKRWIFDHHQDRYSTDSDTKTTYAAVGRVWNYFGNSESYPEMTELIHAIDLHDTGVRMTALGKSFRWFAPNWNEPDTSMDEAFEEALAIVIAIFKRTARKDEAEAAAPAFLASCPVQNGILVLPNYMPYQEYATEHTEITAVCYPDRNGKDLDLCLINGRGLFPKEWMTTPPEGIYLIRRATAVCSDMEHAVHAVGQKVKK